MRIIPRQVSLFGYDFLRSYPARSTFARRTDAYSHRTEILGSFAGYIETYPRQELMDIPIRRYKEKMRSKKRSAPLLFISLSALTLLTFASSLYGQTKKDTLTFRIMGYNVENLFDCSHDTLKNDYEFLPDAVRHWNYSKYKKKLDAVARVIIAVGEWSPPALVALCEVENDSVLRDLTRYSVLREADYRYVITHSPDERGINVALLYQRGLFKLLSGQSYSVTKAHKSNRPTRDILHVSGLLLNKDTLDVLI